MGSGGQRAALLVFGILGAAACGSGAASETVNNLGGSGTSGAPIAGMAAPTAGTGALPMAGTMAPPVGASGTGAPGMAGIGGGAAGTGTGMAGMGMAGIGGGMAGTGAAGMDMGAAGMGMAGMGMAGMGMAGEGGVGGMAGAGMAGTGASGTGGSGESSCLDGITNFGAQGPFQYMQRNSGSIKFWVPNIPSGCKVPVVHLANGTGATCSAYIRVLQALASHGFLAACYESTQTGAGTQGVMALETAFNMFPEMLAKKIGSTGHSQGGQAAFTVLQQAEAKFGDQYTYAGLAMQPASGFGAQPSIRWQQMYSMIKSPMFMFSGTADVLVSRGWVQQGFDALADNIEAYHWSAIGSTHIPTPQDETAQVAIPWFRWKLLGDQAACRAFKALPDGPDWDSVKEQNPQPCL